MSRFLAIAFAAASLSFHAHAQDPTRLPCTAKALLACLKESSAFQQREGRFPNHLAELNPSPKAQAKDATGQAIEWIYPLSHGAEIQIGQQGRVVICSPLLHDGSLWAITEKSRWYQLKGNDAKQIHDAIQRAKSLLNSK